MALLTVESLTGVSASRRRTLAWQVLEVSAPHARSRSQPGLAVDHDGVSLDPRVHLEKALAAIGTAHREQVRLTLSQAKMLVRSWGPVGVGLASRLGRLSKSRNATAHLDVTLLSDINEALAAQAVASRRYVLQTTAWMWMVVVWLGLCWLVVAVVVVVAVVGWRLVVVVVVAAVVVLLRRWWPLGRLVPSRPPRVSFV